MNNCLKRGGADHQPFTIIVIALNLLTIFPLPLIDVLVLASLVTGGGSGKVTKY